LEINNSKGSTKIQLKIKRDIRDNGIKVTKMIYILMATYNGEKFINEQIDSLLNQTYENWKLIIHDDNSKDRTVSIVKEYQSKYNNKIKLLDDNISTGGAKENFTYLLNKIDDNYDYIMFCDQDDIWINNKIEVTLNKMIAAENKYKNKPILIHTDLYIYENVETSKYKKFMEYQNLNSGFDTINRLIVQNIVTGCTVMINKLSVEKIKKIPKEAIMHDWWIAIVISSFGKIVFLDNATILYRQHENNIVGVKQKNLSFYIKKIVSRNSFECNSLQMKKFLNIYKESLNKNDKKIIEVFISLQSYSYLKARYLMWKYKIYKHGFIRNIALFLGIIKF